MTDSLNTSIHDYRIVVDFYLRSPVLSSSTDAARMGIDASPWLVEDNQEHYPVLPGSLIKGNLLHSLKTLIEISPDWVSEDEIHRWFGGFAESHNNAPNRSSIRYADTWKSVKFKKEAYIRYRIKMNDHGTVDHGALQQIDIPHAVGESVAYSGWLEFSGSQQEADRVSSVLNKGLSFISALGAYKGIGFGVVLDVSVSAAEIVPEKPFSTEAAMLNKQFGLRFEFDRPLCINGVLKQDGNRFESLESLPGGAIKGAVATRIQQLGGKDQWPDLYEHLDKIHFSHATPAPKQGEQKRETCPPLNLFHCNDAVDEKQNGFGMVAPNTPLPTSGDIRFQLDWKSKEWEHVNQQLKPLKTDEHESLVCTPKRTLRVRTAITQGAAAAEDGQLFALEAIDASKHSWLCNVSLPELDTSEKADAVAKQLSQIMRVGLNSIGKLDACTTNIESCAGHWPLTVATVDVDESLVSIMLLSDTRLFRHEDLQLTGTHSAKELHDHYSLSWSELSEGELELSCFYAQQTLYGGEYYRRRFGYMDEAYNPWVITKAGSIFYFKVNDSEKCTALLKQWITKGIPVLSALSSDWRKNPLLPENGYGEIVVNPQLPMVQTKESTSA